jgi:hypothetical protein
VYNACLHVSMILRMCGWVGLSVIRSDWTHPLQSHNPCIHASATAAAVQEELLRSSLLRWCTSRALAQPCTQTKHNLAAEASQGRCGCCKPCVLRRVDGGRWWNMQGSCTQTQRNLAVEALQGRCA